MACTTILVGKKASYDGSTIVARNEDSPSGVFTPKKMVVVKPEQQPKEYVSVLSHVHIPLPDKALRYTAMPNAVSCDGVWGAAGVNSENISMTATETITSNERVLAADPFVEFIPANGDIPEQVGGIGEEDMVTLVLPYIHSAREGVLRLGKLLEEYGTYEMNGIAFQDVDEIWWLETIGGHHWIAKRVADEEYVIMPNQLGMDSFDLQDAFSSQKNHLCSADLREFIQKNHLNLSLDNTFNPRDAFGSHSDADHVYNTPRAWIVGRYFNPHSYIWEGDNADYKPSSDNIPFSFVPEKKITIEDVKYVLSHHYQGTEYDPYGKYGDAKLRGCFRPIGINRNNVLVCVQIRPDMPTNKRSLEWIAYGCNVFNALIPFYSNVDCIPSYVGNTSEYITTDNFYWANRLIAALADPHFSSTSAHIERYQQSLSAKALHIINEYDDTVSADLAKANEEIAELAKKETTDLLNKVLYEASCSMKNGFSRSDA